MGDGLLVLPEDSAVAALRREVSRLDEWDKMEADDIERAEQALRDAIERARDRNLRRTALLAAIERLKD